MSAYDSHCAAGYIDRDFSTVISKEAAKQNRTFFAQLIAFAKAGADAERTARPAHVRQQKTRGK